MRLGAAPTTAPWALSPYLRNVRYDMSLSIWQHSLASRTALITPQCPEKYMQALQHSVDDALQRPGVRFDAPYENGYHMGQ